MRKILRKTHRKSFKTKEDAQKYLESIKQQWNTIGLWNLDNKYLVYANGKIDI